MYEAQNSKQELKGEIERFTKTDLDLIVLRLLRIHPMWGYEMHIHIRDNLKVYLSTGTLYPLLHSLEDTGHIEGSWESVGGRGRKIYSLTPKGERKSQLIMKAKKVVSDRLEKLVEGLELPQIPTDIKIPDEIKEWEERQREKVSVPSEIKSSETTYQRVRQPKYDLTAYSISQLREFSLEQLREKFKMSRTDAYSLSAILEHYDILANPDLTIFDKVSLTNLGIWTVGIYLSKMKLFKLRN